MLRDGCNEIVWTDYLLCGLEVAQSIVKRSEPLPDLFVFVSGSVPLGQGNFLLIYI